MKETVVEVKDVSIKFNMSSEKYDSFKEYIIKMIKLLCAAIQIFIKTK